MMRQASSFCSMHGPARCAINLARVPPRRIVSTVRSAEPEDNEPGLEIRIVGRAPGKPWNVNGRDGIYGYVICARRAALWPRCTTPNRHFLSL